ncbi:SpoIIE family protein phosphatase [Solwaraspora sp. WMMD791]|uniref:PP2C family protein-serine/threonine phosphatase n=1 Tax=Solwaraspora sp. WMMD791 TaxID=3016086 RepID=UPI00249A0759|nr:GAF domain-containing SpoIIE family protein phosphatase [Solwaraspora sp. WMMD791]WFE30061.1 SpoIIE family protein phosphatase [Solwaraspora sp. WMMD791]
MQAEGGNAGERLKRIEAVTDPALSGLSFDALLVESLARTGQLLDVDTAAVCLLDAHSQQLVTVAAWGIEAFHGHPVRLPLRRGYAGQVMSSGSAVRLADPDDDKLAHPGLRAQGIRSLLAVPVTIDGSVTGVLHVASREQRTYQADDEQMLRLVADRIALASHARERQVDRTTTVALQHDLLPTDLPTVPGLQFAARYVAGHDVGVGGDWYDVLPLPDGWVGVAIGDVTGRGVHAATVMGRLRSALRAYALETTDPADVLARLDRKVQHFEPGMMATVCYATIDPTATVVSMSTAGHPPPVAVDGDGARCLQVPADLPLGTRIDRPRRVSTVELSPGSLLFFFTDGLVERCGPTIDSGLRQVCEAITASSAETACVSVMSALVDGRPLVDDIAMLALRRD